jgi:hypothetical protein
MRIICSTASALAALAFVAGASAAFSTSRLATDAQMNALIDQMSFVAEGRVGNRATNGTFELDLHQSDPGIIDAQGQYAWQNGATVPFTVTYAAATGLVVFTIDGVTISHVYNNPFTDVFMRTRATVADTMILLDNLEINGMPLGDVSQAVNPGAGIDILRVEGLDSSMNMTVTGDVTLAWGATAPSNSQLAFQMKFATVIPSPAGAAALALMGLATLRRRR